MEYTGTSNNKAQSVQGAAGFQSKKGGYEKESSPSQWAQIYGYLSEATYILFTLQGFHLVILKIESYYVK